MIPEMRPGTVSEEAFLPRRSTPPSHDSPVTLSSLGFLRHFPSQILTHHYTVLGEPPAAFS